MRINIYQEELTDRVEIVEKVAGNTGKKYYGLRIYLKTIPEMYPPLHEDDDTSAVTFWVDDIIKLDGLWEAVDNLLWSFLPTHDSGTE